MTQTKPGVDSATTAVWQVIVTPRDDAYDARGRAVLEQIRRAGFAHVSRVRSRTLYYLAGAADAVTIEQIASDLLCDPVTEHVAVRLASEPGSVPARRGAETPPDPTVASVDVYLRAGVMDPVALSAVAAIGDAVAAGAEPARLPGGPKAIERVRTARRYEISGAASIDELEQIAARVLANDVIETVHLRGFGRYDPAPEPFPVAGLHGGSRRTVPLLKSDDEALQRLSRVGHLFLSLDEMRAIQTHYRKLGREPSDLELETLAQTWSEHCVHKTLKSSVVYRGAAMELGPLSELDARRVEIRYENLLRSTIAQATFTLDRPWCLSVFKDNAGVIEFDDLFGVAFKVETHNHPSAIEPYGGAATGVGGCIRDIMGCGLGAAPVASTDVFCVAPPGFDVARLPRGVLHPRRTLAGVVAGVRDYGNRMGIPTVNGAIYFHERYLANPLVFCGCVGLIPRDRIEKAPHPDDWIVVAGGRTGRDGIHGATFSSAELTDTHVDEFSHAVQIGNAIEEKKLLDALLRARGNGVHEPCLFSAVTDCGAGGLSSAIGEMAAEIGAVVDLEKVPLKYAGLRYDEIWISEAQERMVFAVPPDLLSRFLSVFAEEQVEATPIGRFASDGVLRVRFRGEVVGELDVDFLHHGLPRSERIAEWTPQAGAVRPRSVPASGTTYGSFTRQLLGTLAHPNVASKEAVIRVYDHEVQGGSVIKPLAGPGAGPSDGAVLRPRLDGRRGIALGLGLAPHLSDYDPYLMAVAAVDEALRNVICLGADPERTAILDNFCWGGVQDARAMGELVRACQGAHDAAMAYELPFISGKDSLNNQFTQSAAEAARCRLPERMTIPGTLLISAIGLIDDVERCATPDLKRAGNRIVLVSRPADQLGLEAAYNTHLIVSTYVRRRTAVAAHDVSDGGLASALAEMCVAGQLGMRIDFSAVDSALCDEELLFGEPLTTYVLEIADDKSPQPAVPVAFAAIGEVTSQPRLTIWRQGRSLVDVELTALSRAFRGNLHDVV